MRLDERLEPLDLFLDVRDVGVRVVIAHVYTALIESACDVACDAIALRVAGILSGSIDVDHGTPRELTGTIHRRCRRESFERRISGAGYRRTVMADSICRTYIIPAMPTFHGNNELALHVPDPATAVAFYLDVLGCAEVSRTPDCIEVANGALRLFLL